MCHLAILQAEDRLELLWLSEEEVNNTSLWRYGYITDTSFSLMFIRSAVSPPRWSPVFGLKYLDVKRFCPQCPTSSGYKRCYQKEFCQTLSYNVWVQLGVVDTWRYVLEQSVKVSERRLYYLPRGMFSLWTLWSRSNLICRIYFTMWHRRVLLITFCEWKQQRRRCSPSGVGSERLKRCRISTPHTEVQGPGVFDSAMIEAECSLCKVQMGNSSAVWYNSWRLAWLDELSIEDRFFSLVLCIFPQVASLTRHRLQSHLIICGSPLRGLHDNPPKNRHEVSFPSAEIWAWTVFSGLCVWVCEAASQPCCLAPGTEITALAYAPPADKASHLPRFIYPSDLSSNRPCLLFL